MYNFHKIFGNKYIQEFDNKKGQKKEEKKKKKESIRHALQLVNPPVSPKGPPGSLMTSF
jgi:hypothetical protein